MSKDPSYEQAIFTGDRWLLILSDGTVTKSEIKDRSQAIRFRLLSGQQGRRKRGIQVTQEERL